MYTSILKLYIRKRKIWKKYIKYAFKSLLNHVGCVVTWITWLREFRGFVAPWVESVEFLQRLRWSKYSLCGSTFYLGLRGSKTFLRGLVLLLKITIRGALKPSGLCPQPSQKPQFPCCFFRASKLNLVSQKRRQEKNRK